MSSHNLLPESVSERHRIYAPWEKTFARFATPFEEFIHNQTASGILLISCTILALLLANSGAAEAYRKVLETELGFRLGALEETKTLHHWINDGLMALFFFVVGLEIKREVLVGDLASWRQAALPILAAIGGMLAPAVVYAGITLQGDALRGWGIPMATDIAFAVGAVVLLGQRLPRSLLTFLLALAIVDDLGAVIIIALFYTQQLNWQLLGVAVALLGVMALFNRAGIRRPWPYFLLGLSLWAVMLESGIHPTLAGVFTALMIPARPVYDPQRFAELFEPLLERYKRGYQPDESVLRNQELRSVLQTMENGIVGITPPLQRLERKLHVPVALLVMPLFALANAGISLELNALEEALRHPVALGVIAGLLAGKTLGITVVTWLGLKAGIVELPKDTTFSHIIGIALLAGIGFTMSLFISELAFQGFPEYLLAAKVGILCASMTAGVLGLLWLRWVSSKPGRAEVAAAV